jgi:hypothetical protein
MAAFSGGGQDARRVFGTMPTTLGRPRTLRAHRSVSDSDDRMSSQSSGTMPASLD